MGLTVKSRKLLSRHHFFHMLNIYFPSSYVHSAFLLFLFYLSKATPNNPIDNEPKYFQVTTRFKEVNNLYSVLSKIHRQVFYCQFQPDTNRISLSCIWKGLFRILSKQGFLDQVIPKQFRVCVICIYVLEVYIYWLY